MLSPVSYTCANNNSKNEKEGLKGHHHTIKPQKETLDYDLTTSLKVIEPTYSLHPFYLLSMNHNETFALIFVVLA